MIVGFTGTRKGMTSQQIELLSEILKQLKPDSVHHGCCIGADEQFHKLALKIIPDAMVFGHPSNIPHTQGDCICDIRYNALPPLVRNRQIVDASDLLIAAPDTKDEQLRSGTWATVRIARHLKKEIIFIYPQEDKQ